MATVYIAEFQDFARTTGSWYARTPPLAEQTVAITAGSVASTNPFGDTTRFVRVHTDAICSISFGVSPTATQTKMRMSAGSTEYFAVQAGHKIAVITNT